MPLDGVEKARQPYFTCMAICSIPVSTVLILSSSHFFSNSSVACLQASLSSARCFISASPMRTAGFGGHDGGDEGRVEEQLPLEGATGMVVSVAGAFDRASRLHSRV